MVPEVLPTKSVCRFVASARLPDLFRRALSTVGRNSIFRDRTGGRSRYISA